VKFVFTIHAEEKLQTKEAKLLGISKNKIVEAIRHPITVDKTLNPHRNIGRLSNTLSLAVIWREENGIILIITFFPAEKGRYEGKILRRR